jgi:hypothetical protein
VLLQALSSIAVRFSRVKRLCTELYTLQKTTDVRVRVEGDVTKIICNLHNSVARARVSMSCPVSWAYPTEALPWTVNWTVGEVRFLLLSAQLLALLAHVCVGV